MADSDPRLELVHRDDRGDIYRILIPPDIEVMLFRCVAGHLRGGHSHTAPEIVSLLAGRMNYHRIVDGVPEVLELRPGDVRVNQPGDPHMGEFLEDSWVIEWKFGPNGGIGDWQTINYPPMRALVAERREREASE